MTVKIFTTKVAGVTFDNRQSVIAHLTGNEPCRIVPQPDNEFDPNALAVEASVNGVIANVGYIPRDLASQIAPYLEGESVMVSIVEITGGFEIDEARFAAYGLLLRIQVPVADDDEDTDDRDDNSNGLEYGDAPGEFAEDLFD